MARESLFNAVRQLQAEREARNADMMSFMSGLSDTGKIGYAIGAGLSSLFSGSQDPKMLQAQREDAYAKQYLMEQDPVKRAAMRQGAYALSTELGQNLDAVEAAEASSQAKALKTQLEMENIRSQIRERDAKPAGGKPSVITPITKPGKTQYEGLIKNDPTISKLVDPLTDWAPSWLGGSKLSSSELNDLLIERANTIRQQQKGTSLRDSLLMAVDEYTAQSGDMQQPTAPTTQAPQAPTMPSLKGVTGTK
jgi:hypothetical protein